MASTAVLLGLLVQILLLHGSAARRLIADAAPALQPTASPPQPLVGTDGLICGGKEIFSMLTSDLSVEAARLLDWNKVLVVADDFLAGQAGLISELKPRVERLKREIREREAQERPLDMSKDQVEELISASLSAEGAFGSLERAVTTKCGGEVQACMELEPQVPADALEASAEAFEELARQKFTGSLRARGNFVTGVCKELLPPGDDLGESDCGELCLSFGSTAQKLSGDSAGFSVGAASRELRRQLQQLEEQLRGAEADAEDCQGRRALLEAFRLQLAPLQQDISDQHDALRKARRALALAERSVKDWDSKVAVQDVAALALASKAESLAAAAASGTAALEELKRREEAVKVQLQAAADELEAALARIVSVESAVEAVQGLKLVLAQVMLHMTLLAEEGAREPVRDLGLAEYQDIPSMFPASPGLLGSAEDTKTALESLKLFCQQKALPAFRDVASSVDLTPLCATGDVGTNFEGLNEAATYRMELLKKDLQAVQASLDPFRHGLSAERAAELERLWEPEGLRQTPELYGRAPFYKQYLKDWKITKKFHKLYKQLSKVLKQEVAARDKVADKKASLDAAMREAELAAQAAAEEVGGLLASSKLAQAEHADARAALAQLASQLKEASSGREALRRAFALAEQRYAAALDRLLAAHKGGSAMLELEAEATEGAAVQRLPASAA